jgi:predicted DCC family thiol-disulfide oxidoreductase YuxK/GNAT superfamily N-acetyltransferase
MEDLPESSLVVLYDGECGFCKVMLAVLLRWDRARRLAAVPIQSLLGGELLHDIPSQDRLRSWHLIDDTGALHSGGPAIPLALAALPEGRPIARFASRFPGATSRVYDWVARHRVFLGRFLGRRSRTWATRVIAERSEERDWLLRPAREEDAKKLTALVDAAYGHYVERLGMRPGPMREDYLQVVRCRNVTVAASAGEIVGLLVLAVTEEGFTIENVAVHPSHQGAGIGRALLERAENEARRAGYDSVALYTHEKMGENLALYERIGYAEYDRRSSGDFSRVFMRKRL